MAKDAARTGREKITQTAYRIQMLSRFWLLVPVI